MSLTNADPAFLAQLGGAVWADADNCQVDHDCDDIDGTGNASRTDGAAFSTWINKGLLGGALFQATVGARPVFRASLGAGGMPCVDFGGAAWMTSTLPASAFAFLHAGNGATIYILSRFFSGGLSTVSTGSTPSTVGVMLGNNGLTRGLHAIIGSGAAGGSSSTGTVPASSQNVLSGSFGSVAGMRMAVNGSVIRTSPFAGAVGTAPAWPMSVACGPPGSSLVTTRVSRILAFSSIHDATTEAAIIAEMARRAAVAGFPTP